MVDPEYAPTSMEESSGWLAIAQNEHNLGNFEAAGVALNHYATLSKEPLLLAQEQLSLAMARGDEEGVQSAKKAVRARDRRMRASNFVVGNAEVLSGEWEAAMEAFEAGYENEYVAPNRRAFSTLHAFGAGVLAGRTRTKLAQDGLALMEEDDWVARLLGVVLGTVTREQILAEAAEGRDYLNTGQCCEAYFALAFAPGQDAAGRRADLTACVETGMVGYVEYEFAISWLRQQGLWQ